MQRIDKRCKGLSLIELALIAVVTGILISGFNTLIQDRKFNTVSDEIKRALILARSEAMKRGQSTFISAIDGSDNSNESGDSAFTPAQGEEIYKFTKVGKNITIDVQDNLGVNFTQIEINSRGRLNIVGTAPILLDFCNSSSSNESGRRATTSVTGQVTVSLLNCS